MPVALRAQPHPPDARAAPRAARPRPQRQRPGRQPAVVRRRARARGRARRAGDASRRSRASSDPRSATSSAIVAARPQAAAVRGRRAACATSTGSASSRSRPISSSCPGVSLQVGPRRTYPFGPMAAHLLGYVGEVNQQRARRTRRGYHLGRPDRQGGRRARLGGLPARRRRRPAGRGRRARPQAARARTRSTRRPGNTLVLTHRPRPAARPPRRRSATTTASIVALDPRNGEILAMVSRPGLRPQRLRARHPAATSGAALVAGPQAPAQQPRRAGTVSARARPSRSSMAAAALEEGVITPVHAHPLRRRLLVRQPHFRCWRKGGHGSVNVHEALVQSCDVFFYQVGPAARRRHHRRVLAPLRARRADRHRARAREARGIIPDSAWKRQRFSEPWYRGRDALGRDRPGLRHDDAAPDGERDGDHRQRRHALPAALREARRGARRHACVEERARGRAATLGFKKTHAAADPRGACATSSMSKRGTGKKARVRGDRGRPARPARRRSSSWADGDKLEPAGCAREQRDHAWFIAFAPVDESRDRDRRAGRARRRRRRRGRGADRAAGARRTTSDPDDDRDAEREPARDDEPAWRRACRRRRTECDAQFDRRLATTSSGCCSLLDAG